MVVEVFLCLLHFLLIQQTQVAEGAIGKSVDDGTPQIAGGSVVDESTQISTNGGTQYHEDDIQVAAVGSGTIGGRWYHQFTGSGDNGALEHHQEGDGPVVQVVDAPSDKCGHGNVEMLKS